MAGKKDHNRVNICHICTLSGVWEYIEGLRDTVCHLEGRVQKAHSNLTLLDNILSTWVQAPIFERRDGKKDTLLSLEDKAERLKKVYVIEMAYNWLSRCCVYFFNLLVKLNMAT